MIGTVRVFAMRLAAGLKARTRITSVIVYAVITLLPQLSSGSLAILYTRAFSSEEYANYGIFAAVYAFIANILDLGLSSGALRNFYRSQKTAKQYFGSILVSSRMLTFSVLPVGAVALYLLWDAIGVRFQQKWAFIPVLLAIAYVDRTEEMLATICRALERPALYAYGRLAHGAALLAAGYMMVFVFRLGVMGSLLGLLIAELIALIAYTLLLRRDFGIVPSNPDWSELSEALRFGFPIVPNRLAGWARLLAVRPVLAHAVRAPDVGIFSFASSMAAVPGMLSSGVEMALGPVYYRRREDHDAALFNTKIRSFAAVYAGSLVPLWALMIVFGPDVIRFISTPDYAAAGPVCSVLLCATFIRMQFLFLSGQIQFLRKTWVMPAITIPSGLAGIVLTLLLAKAYGVMAAAWVLVGVDLAIFVALAWAVHYFEGVNYPVGSALLFVVFLCAVAAVRSSPLMADAATLISVSYRLLLVAITAFVSVVIWVWPNRALIQRLAQR